MDQHLNDQAVKCLFCGQFFRRDRRIGARQRSCKRSMCQKQRKKAQEERWRKQNPGYFSGRYAYVKLWREAHPGYRKALRAKRKHGIQTQIPALNPIKSIRCHLRDNLALSGIQTQILILRHCGNEIWVERALDAA